jgi:type VI protein secretion system component Hcp
VGTLSYPGTPNPPDPGPVPIDSFSWGLSQGGHAGGGGGGAGKATFQDLHLTMKRTTGLPRLAFMAASGKNLKSVQIDTDASAEGGIAVRYCAQNANVRRLQVSNIGSSGQDGVSIDLGYAKLSVQTTLDVGGLAVATFDLNHSTFSFGSADTCPHRV